jgi:hypothetical protein
MTFFFRLGHTLTSLELKPVVRGFLVMILRLVADALEKGDLLNIKSIVSDGEIKTERGLLSEVVNSLTEPFGEAQHGLSEASLTEVGDAAEVYLNQTILLNNEVVFKAANQQSAGVTSEKDGSLSSGGLQGLTDRILN